LGGLATFRFVTLPFRIYNGGEVLLFAIAPWSLYALRKAVGVRAVAAFAICLAAGLLLFMAKLTGLVVFAVNVLAISLFEVTHRRCFRSPLLAIWAGAAIIVMAFLAFWIARGGVPAGGNGFVVTWPSVLFPITAVAFSGVSAVDLMTWLVMHPDAP